MKNLLLGIILILLIHPVINGSNKGNPTCACECNKDSMVVVMRFERKVKPEHVAFFKQSFDQCKAEVMEKEPGCLDYSLFQSYNDSTLFCLTEAWVTKEDHNVHMQFEHTKKHIAETREINDPSFKSSTNYIYWICPGANEKQ